MDIESFYNQYGDAELRKQESAEAHKHAIEYEQNNNERMSMDNVMSAKKTLKKLKGKKGAKSNRATMDPSKSNHHLEQSPDDSSHFDNSSQRPGEYEISLMDDDETDATPMQRESMSPPKNHH